MRPSKNEIVKAIHSTGLMPLLHHGDADTARHSAEACLHGGATVFEFAHRGPNAFNVFQELVKHFASYKDFYLGIGTIMDASMATQYIEAGAHFLVSPIFKQEIADVANKENMVWIPGCATMTEIITASDAGCEIIKIFPGSILGPNFVSSVLPILPKLKLMPTGGVEPNEKNLSAWFDSGVFCVGMGSQLFTKELIESKNWKGVDEKVKEILSLIRKLRNR